MMAIYVMMALGLNIVVGYAGLLDLGYVAFYASAPTRAAGSPRRTRPLAAANFTFGGVGVPVGLGGIHISIWLVLIVAGAIAALAGVIIGLPTLRLRGDYLAIVTLGFGEIVCVVAQQRRLSLQGIAGHCVNLTNGAAGDQPDRPAGVRGLAARHTSACPSDFLSSANSLSLYYWAALVLVALRRLLLAAAARLEARPGVGRDPRGRDGGRRDGRAADADEDVGVRDRRLLRRHRRRIPEEPAGRRVPGTSSSPSRSSSSAW